MKIAFDGQFFLKGNKTGVAWCAENVMLGVGRRKDVEKQINFFGLGYNEEQKAEAEKYRDEGYKIECCSWFHDVIYRLIWNYIPVPYRFFFKKKADVFVFFNFIVPPGVSGKTIAVVHDMAYRAYPETVRKKTRHFLESSMGKSCKRATKVITISEFSKSEILKYISIAADKIAVIPLGVDTHRFYPDYKRESIEQVKEKYHIGESYILYLGTIEPRKNIQKLVQAYAMLKKRCASVPPLILAGGKGWLCDDIYASVEELGLTDCIKFLGYVPDEDAPHLLCGAHLFVFPSLYEGFGLPVLEAMACGTPVVTSNVSSLPEIAHDAAVLVDPNDAGDIMQGMFELLHDEGVRKKYIEAGFERVKEYTWERTVDKYLEVCQEVAR